MAKKFFRDCQFILIFKWDHKINYGSYGSPRSIRSDILFSQSLCSTVVQRDFFKSSSKDTTASVRREEPSNAQNAVPGGPPVGPAPRTAPGTWGATQCAAVNCTGPVLRPHPELPGPRSHAVEPSGVPMRELDTSVLKSV